MNSFDKASTISARSLGQLLPTLEVRGMKLQPYEATRSGYKGRYRVTSTGVALNLEVKAEAHETGNVFIETWSNREAGRVGGCTTSRSATCCCTTVLDSGNAYVMQFHKLRNLDLSAWPEVKQSRYDQSNESWGRLLPVDLLKFRCRTQVFNLPC